MTRETNQSSRDGNEGNKEDEHMTRTACDSSAKVVGDSLLQSTHPLEQEEKMPTEPLPEDEECSKPTPYHRRHSRPQFTVYCSSKHLSSSSKRSKKRYRCEGCRFYCAELARWGNYTGELNELAQMDGIGTIVFDEDGGELEGSWENNCIDGQAVHRLPSGEIFHGTWLDGKRSGKGKCFYKNGDIYEGEYDKGLKCGYGKMSYANGSSYEGYFVADKREGEGIMIHHTGSI